MPSLNLNMNGPFDFNLNEISIQITKNSAGNYALGYQNQEGYFVVKYVGRSDSDVANRLKQHIGEDYSHFKYSYASSPKAAFEKECENYHDFGGDENLVNEIHPRRPDDSYAVCYTDYKISRGTYTEVSKETREGRLYFEALSRNIYLGSGSNFMVRKDVIEEIGGFDESFKRNQDLEFLVRILENYNIAHVNGYQLIVHLENRGNRKKAYSYELTNSIDDFYLTKFKENIEKLNILEKDLLYKYFALERFKRSIGSNNLKDALINLKKNKVGVWLLVKYVFYLINRRITKTIYGFKIQ